MTRSKIPRAIALIGANPSVVQALKGWLNSIEVSVSIHSSAEKMVAELRRQGEHPSLRVNELNPHPCRLVGAVLDTNLPGINGIDLARALKRWYPKLPLIVLTELGDEERERLGSLPTGVSYWQESSDGFSFDMLKDAMSPMLL